MSWTPDQERRLKEMYEANTPARAIAKQLGKSMSAVYQKAWRLGLGDPERQQVSVKRRPDDTPAGYAMGAAARSQHKPCICPARDPIYAAWWKAGWHDKDIALGNSVIKGAA